MKNEDWTTTNWKHKKRLSYPVPSLREKVDDPILLSTQRWLSLTSWDWEDGVARVNIRPSWLYYTPYIALHCLVRLQLGWQMTRTMNHGYFHPHNGPWVNWEIICPVAFCAFLHLRGSSWMPACCPQAMATLRTTTHFFAGYSSSHQLEPEK